MTFGGDGWKEGGREGEEGGKERSVEMKEEERGECRKEEEEEKEGRNISASNVCFCVNQSTDKPSSISSFVSSSIMLSTSSMSSSKSVD